MVSLGKSAFTFTDEDFIGSDLDGAIEIVQDLLSIHGLHFSFSVRADNIVNVYDSDDQMAKRQSLFETLVDAGLYQIFVGIKSLSASQLKRYGKKISVESNVRAIEELNRIGVNYEAGFILFDPLLSQQELLENIIILERTQMWQKTGNLFNHLRPQKNSSYINLLDKMNFRGDYDPDTISFETSFVDGGVEEIYRVGLQWFNEFNHIYLLARSIKNNCNDQCYEKFIYSFRALQFQYLKHLTSCISTKSRIDTNNDKKKFYRNGLKLVKELLRAMVVMEKSLRLSPPENSFKDYCNNFKVDVID